MNNVIKFFKENKRFTEPLDLKDKIRQVNICRSKIAKAPEEVRMDLLEYFDMQIKMCLVIQDDLLRLSSMEKFILIKLLLRSDHELCTSFIIQVKPERFSNESTERYKDSTYSDLSCELSLLVDDYFEDDSEHRRFEIKRLIPD